MSQLNDNATIISDSLIDSDELEDAIALRAIATVEEEEILGYAVFGLNKIGISFRHTSTHFETLSNTPAHASNFSTIGIGEKYFFLELVSE